jgi:hypothetical protein
VLPVRISDELFFAVISMEARARPRRRVGVLDDAQFRVLPLQPPDVVEMLASLRDRRRSMMRQDSRDRVAIAEVINRLRRKDQRR